MTVSRISICLLLTLAAICGGTRAQEHASEEDWIGRLSLRYDLAGWPGKAGPVIAGFDPENALTEKFDLAADHHVRLALEKERMVLRRYSGPVSDSGKADRRSLTAGIAVVRSCAGAQKVLFDHLARPRSMAPFEAPALPYGEVRTEGLGDVCFSVEFGEGSGYRTIEFVRFNVVVLLRAFDGESAGQLMDLAVSIDQSLAARPLYRDWVASKKWPEIVRFEAPSTRVEANSLVPLALSVERASPGSAPLEVDWEMTAGGVVQNGNGLSYQAEGEGVQTLTVLVTDENGLTSSAVLEFLITR